jgi:hypothetical protein
MLLPVLPPANTQTATAPPFSSTSTCCPPSIPYRCRSSAKVTIRPLQPAASALWGVDSVRAVSEGRRVLDTSQSVWRACVFGHQCIFQPSPGQRRLGLFKCRVMQLHPPAGKLVPVFFRRGRGDDCPAAGGAQPGHRLRVWVC